MRWKLGKLFDVDIYVDVSFLVLLGLIAIMGMSSPLGAVGSVALILLVFGVVVLHEYGHIFAARMYGIGCKDITLYIIGGAASLETMPKDPVKEMVVALAGPAVNFVLAALSGILLLSGIPLGSAEMLVDYFFMINVVLGVFNMIPAFPMDGGRVLRAGLGMWPFRKSHKDATIAATSVGQVMAFAFIPMAIYFSNVFMLLIGFFVWTVSKQEKERAQTFGSRPKHIL